MALRRGPRSKAVVLQVQPDELSRCIASVTDHRGTAPGDGLVLLELARARSEAPGVAHLLVTAWDHRGWWELNGLAVRTETPERAEPFLVRGADLQQALAPSRQGVASRSVVLAWWPDRIDLADHSIRAASGAEIPAPPDCSVVADRLILTGEDGERFPSVLETQIGRVGFAPELSDHLGARHSSAIDLVTVQGAPHVVARPPLRAGNTGTIVIAPLELLGSTEPLPAGVVDRRRAGGDEVRQLIIALDPNTQASELMTLLNEGVGPIRRKAAAHPMLPTMVIAEILRVGTDAMRAAAASNPNLPNELVAVAAADPSPAVQEAIAATHRAPLALQHAATGEVRPAPAITSGAA